MDWTPLPPDKCETCGRFLPGWYEERNQHITDSYLEGVPSVRLAKAYGLSEKRTVEVITDELGKRSFLEAWHEEDR